jgi:hypothetical protein
VKITFGHGLNADALGSEPGEGFIYACGCIHIDVWPQDKSPEGYEAAYAAALKEFYPDGQPQGCTRRCDHFPISPPP